MTTSEGIATTQVTDAVRSLGATAEEVAVTLRFGGWLGFRKNAAACPIAKYLTTVVPEVSGAVVGSDRATIHVDTGDDVAVDLTPAVAGFVLAFDIGAYPELVVRDGDPVDK